MLLAHKELRSQVFLGDGFVVQDGQTANTCQYEILGNLVRQRLNRD